MKLILAGPHSVHPYQEFINQHCLEMQIHLMLRISLDETEIVMTALFFLERVTCVKDKRDKGRKRAEGRRGKDDQLYYFTTTSYYFA